MSEAYGIALDLLTGATLGVLFYGGLWWTIQRSSSSKSSALWFLGSLMIRTSLALAGFYFVGRGHFERLMACLLGFLVARLIVIRFTRTAGKGLLLDREARHAP